MRKSYLKYFIVLVVITSFLSSCKLIQNLINTEVTPQQKELIYSKAEALKFKRTKSIRKSGKNKQPLRRGQWVTYISEMKTADKDVSLTTMRVIKVSRGTVILETETYSAASDGERTITQITYKNYPVRQKLSYTSQDHKNFFNNVQIVRMRTKSGDQPARDVPQQVLNLSSMGAKNSSKVRSGGLKAIRFATKYLKTSRCYIYDYSVNVMGFTDRGTVYAHSSVPIVGYMKVTGDTSDISVIAFGYRGARSAM